MGNKKLIYLMGAGASYSALPLVKQVLNQEGRVVKKGILDDFDKIFKGFIANNQAVMDTQYPELKTKIIEESAKFYMESSFFSTPDTYIKYLFGKDEERAENAKRMLSTYFFLKQARPKLIDVPLDRRYLDFLVTLWGEGLPSDIGILTWNYDYQIEVASYYQKANNLQSLSEVAFGFPHSFKIYHNQTIGEEGPTDRHSLVKLNGIGGFSYKNQGSLYNHFTGGEKTAEGICESVTRILANESSIKFAWETEPDGRFTEKLKEYIKGAKILVVIGYSFPFFNRNIDKVIVGEFAKLPDSKIFIQDPRGSADSFLSQFNLPKEFLPNIISNTESFYIPYEY
jgi:hypothetical protein